MISCRHFSGIRVVCRHLACEERGSELVEFAIVAPIFFMLVFGSMGFATAMYTYHFTSYAAREATRYAIVRGSTWTGTACATATTMNCDATAADLLKMVQGLVPPGLSSSLLTVSSTWPGTALQGVAMRCNTEQGANGPGCEISVKVTYNFSYQMPFLPASVLAMKSTSSAVILQ